MSLLEKEILGSFLKDNTLLQEANLTIEHFQESHHKALFTTMKKLSNENKAIDHVVLMTTSPDLVMSLGGVEYIASLETKGNPNNFETYEKELIQQYKEKATESLVNEWLTGKEKDNQRLIDELERINEEGQTDEVDTMNLLAELFDEINQPKADGVTGIPSGIKSLDLMTGGWQPENSIIVGARPSMGKTATLLKFMLSASMDGDVPIVFSLEMSAKSLLRRLASTIARINGFLAKTPQNLTEGLQKKWIDAVGQLSNLEFEIYDNSFQTIQYIRSKVRKAQNKYQGKRIVAMIDYLTLIKNDGNFQSDHAKVSDTSQRLKAIAKDYHIPVITLAQLSRSVEQRQDKRPMNSDLRESGSIEQDADIIMMLYRESYYNKELDSNDMEIIITKQREGATGTIVVDYNRSIGEISDRDN